MVSATTIPSDVAIVGNDSSQDDSDQLQQEFGNNESSYLLPQDEDIALPVVVTGCQEENEKCDKNKEYLCPLQKSVAIIKVNFCFISPGQGKFYLKENFFLSNFTTIICWLKIILSFNYISYPWVFKSMKTIIYIIF